MKALVFAAGLGTRLRPLTLDRPKALVEVGGEPMLGRVIRRLVDAGVDGVVVNVHHFAQKVIDYLRAEDFGVEVAVSDESDLLLDTGGGLLKARRLLDDGAPFFVHNADILSQVDLGDLYRRHLASGADVSLLVQRRDSSRRLLFDSTLRLRGWTNCVTGEVRPAGLSTGGLLPASFGGIHVLSPSVFPLLESYGSNPVFSITPFYIDSCGALDIRGIESGALWFDIGRPESLAAARRAICG